MVGRERKILPFNTTDPDVQALLAAIYRFSEPDFKLKGKDITLLQVRN